MSPAYCEAGPGAGAAERREPWRCRHSGVSCPGTPGGTRPGPRRRTGSVPHLRRSAAPEHRVRGLVRGQTGGGGEVARTAAGSAYMGCALEFPAIALVIAHFTHHAA